MIQFFSGSVLRTVRHENVKKDQKIKRFCGCTCIGPLETSLVVLGLAKYIVPVINY